MSVIEAGVDSDVERLAVVRHADGGLIVLTAGGNREHGVAEGDLGELECAQIEVGVQLSVIVTCCAGAVAVGSFSKSIR